MVAEVDAQIEMAAKTRYRLINRRPNHPLIATRAGSGEVLHVRFRKGATNTSAGCSDSATS